MSIVLKEISEEDALDFVKAALENAITGFFKEDRTYDDIITFTVLKEVFKRKIYTKEKAIKDLTELFSELYDEYIGI